MDQASGSGEAVAVTPAERPRSAPEQHWLARLSFLFVGLAVVFVAVFAELKSLAMLAVGLVGAVVSLAAGTSSFPGEACGAGCRWRSSS